MKRKHDIVHRIIHYAGSGIWWTLVLMLLIVVGSFVSMYPILIIKRVIDIATRTLPGGIPEIVKLGVMYVAFQIGSVALDAVVTSLRVWHEGALGHRIRTEAFQHIQGLSPAFYDKRDSSELLSKLIQDAETTVSGFFSPAVFLAQQGTRFIIAVVIMASISWKVVLLAIPAGIISWAIAKKAGGIIRHAEERVRQLTERLWSMIADGIHGIRDLQVNNQHEEFARRMSQVSKLLWNERVRQTRVECAAESADTLFFMVTIAVIMTYSGYQVYIGQLTYGALGALIMYSGMLIDPLVKSVNFFFELQRVAVSAKRIFGLFDEVSQVKDSSNAVDIGRAHGGIDLVNVGFSYHSDREILSKVNLSLRPGEKVAIVGYSGVGKSTLVRLLARFYDPTKGGILLDGHQFTDLTMECLRRNIGFVFQDIYLFEGTIRENIKLAMPDASSQELENAATLAGVDKFCSRLEKGLDTEIKFQGTVLSRGERQRIALARCIIKDAPVIILDEVTASIDTITASQIWQRLGGWLADRTCLTIAHNVSTVMDADRIVVLDEGTIVQQGKHCELMTQPGLYRQIFEAQFADNKVVDQYS